MIKVYAKDRHVTKIQKFLNSMNFDNKIYTIYSDSSSDNEQFDLGISYGYNRKITDPLLSTLKKGFVNFHPAPLPEYKGNLGIMKSNYKNNRLILLLFINFYYSMNFCNA